MDFSLEKHKKFLENTESGLRNFSMESRNWEWRIGSQTYGNQMWGESGVRRGDLYYRNQAGNGALCRRS